MAESTARNLVQPAASACDGPVAARSDVAAAPALVPDAAAAAAVSDEQPSTSTCHADHGDATSPSPPPLSSVIAPNAAAQSVVVALHRIASTTIPAAAVPVAAGATAGGGGGVGGGGGRGRARATSVAAPGSIRRSSTAVVLNVARTLRQQVTDASTLSRTIAVRRLYYFTHIS